mgnify:CR=1 FL=1
MTKAWDKVKPGDDISLTVEGIVVNVIEPYYFYRDGIRFLAHNVVLESKGKHIHFNLEVETNE